MVKKAKGKITSKINIGNAVNSCPSDWREQNANSKVSSQFEMICPIRTAIQKSITTEEPEAWYPVFKKSSGISAETDKKPAEIARQHYRECILLSLI